MVQAKTCTCTTTSTSTSTLHVWYTQRHVHVQQQVHQQVHSMYGTSKDMYMYNNKYINKYTPCTVGACTLLSRVESMQEQLWIVRH